MSELISPVGAARAIHLAAQGMLQARRRKAAGVFEPKAMILEPGVRVSERFTRAIATAGQRCARWHRCPPVAVGAASPHEFGARLGATLQQGMVNQMEAA
jgi:uncharacterized protein